MNPIERPDGLDEQFILRLPMTEAKVVREMLLTKPRRIKKNVSIEINENMRNVQVRIKKKLLRGTVKNLPTIIESNKTVDGIHLYKTADICQIMCCSNDNDNANQDNTDINANKIHNNMIHGLCPPMKNCKITRMRKTLRNREEPEEAKEIEKELLYLLRMDLEAVSTKYEFIEDSNTKLHFMQNKKAAEKSIFGDISDCSSDSSSKNDIMDYTN